MSSGCTSGEGQEGFERTLLSRQGEILGRKGLSQDSESWRRGLGAGDLLGYYRPVSRCWFGSKDVINQDYGSTMPRLGHRYTKGKLRRSRIGEATNWSHFAGRCLALTVFRFTTLDSGSGHAHCTTADGG